MLLSRSKAQNGMPEFDNPSFLRLGLRQHWPSDYFFQRCFRLNLGLWNWRLRLLSFFLGAGDGTGDGIGRDSAREPVTALEFEPVKDLVKIPEIEPVWLWDCLGDCSVKSIGSELSTLGFFFNADRLTLLNIVLPAALVAPASLEEDLVSMAKALEQVLEQNLDLAPFADSFCSSKG
ncbi:hypothetical protein CK203_054598 [Vitis vinifera]|uniref:Uncharacterized protein n=1 Tax=Vitis vinifera TaxID=29760 RepID=A0A438GRT8_VITVI|nr:hypothetical protein CK203_054598 [Vitis vinifera]